MSHSRATPERAALWILSVCAVGFLAALLVSFPLLARPFARLLEDFGGPIPSATRAATTWLGPTLGAIVASLLAAGLYSHGASRRLGLLIAAALLAMVGLAGCYVALQWPLFTLPDQIKAD